MAETLKILIVEDEPVLALGLKRKLQKYNYDVVDYVTSIEDFQETIEQNSSVNLLIMDINLRNSMSGIECYEHMHIKIPVIYVSAYTEEGIVDQAILTNPLGYLVKPINISELLILLKIAQQKLDKEDGGEIISLSAEYTYDMKHDLLYHKTVQVPLTGKKLNLLRILIEAKGKYIPLSVLEERLYRDEPVSSSSLRTLIYRLRSQMNEKMIESKRLYGVRIVLS